MNTKRNKKIEPVSTWLWREDTMLFLAYGKMKLARDNWVPIKLEIQ
jgi:hypothetical protein